MMLPCQAEKSIRQRPGRMSQRVLGLAIVIYERERLCPTESATRVLLLSVLLPYGNSPAIASKRCFKSAFRGIARKQIYGDLREYNEKELLNSLGV